MNPLTILIPVKDCEKFLPTTLGNVLLAKSGIEVLVADGGSTDSTLQIIDIYRLKGLSIRVISENDKGQSNALNKLLSEVKTDFFIWLNADDVIMPEFITYALETINSKSQKELDSLLSITSNSILIDSNDDFIAYQYCLGDNYYLIKNGIWFGKFPCRVWNTKMAKRCGGLNEDLHYCMDFDFLRRQFIENTNVQSIHSHKFLGAFRHHTDSKTGNPQNTPLVMAEMASLLAQTSLDRRRFRIFSVLLRITNFRYLYYRFIGGIGFFRTAGKTLAEKLRHFN